MMKKYIVVTLICLASIISVAQNNTVVRINFLPAISLGKTADFTQGFSPRGSEVSFDKFIAEDLSVGLSLGWNVFRSKITGKSFEYNDFLVTGTQFRYTNIVPVNIKANKYFGSSERKPFIGIGIGTTYTKQTNNTGIFSFVDDQWQFNLSPEAGIQAMINPGLIGSFKIKYSYSLKANGFPAMSYIGFGFGIGIL